MTNLAVEEKPATQTTSEAESTPVSEDREVTAGSEEVQQNSDPADNQRDGESLPDPREARLQALAQAEREEAIEEGRTKALQELQGNTQAQQREQERLKVRNTFTTEIGKVDQVFARAVDNYGQPRPLNLAEQNAVKASFNELNKAAIGAAEESIADQVREVAYNILPKAAQETLTSLTQGEVDLPTYLNHWAETAALHTKAVKAMDLDAAIKASSKVKREVEAAKLASYDDGREQGRLDPPGTSPDGGRKTVRSAPGMPTWEQLQDKYGDGTATKAEVAEYERLRDQRAKSR